MNKPGTRARLVAADLALHREALVTLQTEYVTGVFAEVAQHFAIPAQQMTGMPASAYVTSIMDKVCGDTPPRGIVYLVMVDGQPAGMGGLRYGRPEVAELKRLYVRPAFRGMKLGERVLQQLLADAAAFGYRRMCLDTAPFMHAAHRLYAAHGFTDCPAYAETEVPQDLRGHWRFMERAL